MSDSNGRKEEFNRIYALALEHAQAGRETESEFEFGRALAFAPELWCEVATKLGQRGEETSALDHFKSALQVTKHAGMRSSIFNNVAVIYAKRGQLKDAVRMIDFALEEDRGNVDALCNLGQIRKWEGNLEESNSIVCRALAKNPWHNDTQFLQALNTLDSGDYKRGFELYECRWRSRTNGIRRVEAFQPDWPGPGSIDFRTGKPFKKLFVYCEQGAGDVFLMLRYARLIREAGLWQHWALKPGMSSLVGDLVDSWSDTSMDEVAPEEFDCHIPSASLPYLFGTTIETIPPCPYIQKPSFVAPYKDVREGLHVGIAWRGSAAQFNDNIRSTNLDHWKPVLDVPGVTFHSLQVDGALEALNYPQLVLSDAPKDWMQTAIRLAGLDLLISIDSGIVHLAGAMGLPVWCALHCRPYFVFPINREDTPWYPSVRLFKQKKAFEWEPVFKEIANELRRFVGQVR